MGNNWLYTLPPIEYVVFLAATTLPHKVITKDFLYCGRVAHCGIGTPGNRIVISETQQCSCAFVSWGGKTDEITEHLKNHFGVRVFDAETNEEL